MTEITKSYNEQAQDYDNFIRKLVPDYEVFHDVLVSFLNKPSTVLDIGCGTGNSSACLKNNNPNVKLTCLDTSPQMLNIAMSKLGSQHIFYESSIENFEIDQQFDAVVSIMVMHNIQKISERLKSYQKIANALRSGGSYLSVDIFLGENDKLQSVYMIQWRDFMLKNISKNEVDGKWLKLHKEKDKPIKLSEHMRLLGKAGFTTIDVLHKRFQFAMTIAQL